MDVELRPEVERMVLDRVRRGEYHTASALVNVVVENLLAVGNGYESKPDLRSLELAQDAPADLQWLDEHGAAYLGEWVAWTKAGWSRTEWRQWKFSRLLAIRASVGLIVDHERALYISHYDDLAGL